MMGLSHGRVCFALNVFTKIVMILGLVSDLCLPSPGKK